jgi:excisionase family DNA binding protein
MVDEKLLTPRQVANALSVHYRTVLRLIEDKKIKAINVGNQLRIKPSDLADYIKQMEV